MMNARKEIWESWLASGEPVLADGAMGTLLHERGVPIDTCFDELNLTRPELVGGIHAITSPAHA
jgi:homocysteine S-methyltransferase